MNKDWMKMAGISSSEITDEAVFRRRRQLLQLSAAAGLTGFISTQAQAASTPLSGPIVKTDYTTDEELTSEETATSYNNFYELGTDKSDPARHADRLVTDPWSVTIDGECAKPGTYTLEDILKPHGIEERVYRLRCVEAWSMVIPWNGFALGDLLKRFEPTGNAKYVAFETVVQDDLPGIRRNVLEWPYLSVGMYGNTLPGQNGAPLRLVVPWKYGYKSIKSIVRISFTEKQPETSWNMSAPQEYGFYSNVNPTRSHPRWSQAKERRLSGDTSGLAALFSPKIETHFMNGYGDEVASLYEGMDLIKNH